MKSGSTEGFRDHGNGKSQTVLYLQECSCSFHNQETTPLNRDTSPIANGGISAGFQATHLSLSPHR